MTGDGADVEFPIGYRRMARSKNITPCRRTLTRAWSLGSPALSVPATMAPEPILSSGRSDLPSAASQKVRCPLPFHVPSHPAPLRRPAPPWFPSRSRPVPSRPTLLPFAVPSAHPASIVRSMRLLGTGGHLGARSRPARAGRRTPAVGARGAPGSVGPAAVAAAPQQGRSGGRGAGGVPQTGRAPGRYVGGSWSWCAHRPGCGQSLICMRVCANVAIAGRARPGPGPGPPTTERHVWGASPTLSDGATVGTNPATGAADPLYGLDPELRRSERARVCCLTCPRPKALLANAPPRTTLTACWPRASARRPRAARVHAT